jgi:hypothetical protein
VLAEDIVPETRDDLAERVQREGLDNVAVKLGTPDDPLLPHQSFDRIFLVHMYHEVQSPYAFLWHMRDGLKPGDWRWWSTPTALPADMGFRLPNSDASLLPWACSQSRHACSPVKRLI